MLNPYIVPIEGDLSRADVVVLTLLCRGKTVVEYGVGASTIILSQVAEKVISYDTDLNWINKIKPKATGVDFKFIPMDGNAVTPEPCDVLFDDGHSNLRWDFLKLFWPLLNEYAILHDGRMSYPGNILKRFFDMWEDNGPNRNPDNSFTGSLEEIKWNWLESNMVVMKKRNCTLKYEDWKKTECQNYV